MIDDYPELLNHWFVICQSSELRNRPLAKTLLDQPLVVFRSNGRATALMDRCPHRNAPLSAGWLNQDRIVCPYHGWQFNADGNCHLVPGLCSPVHDSDNFHIPARRVSSYPVIEQDGLVWVFPGGSPRRPPPRFNLLSVPGYGHFTARVTMTGSLPDAIENFLDGTHTHFVHSGLIRTEGQRKSTTAIVRRNIDSVEAQYPDEGQQSGLISKLFGAGIDNVYGRFTLPSLAQLEYHSGTNLRLLISLCFTPTLDDSLDVFAIVVGRAPSALVWLAKPLLQGLFWQAFEQDKRIVALQTANLKRFGGERYTYTDLDLLRPHVIRLLKHGPFSPSDKFEERVQMLM